MQRLKRQKIQDILDQQNASVEADMNSKGKGKLKFLLQQTELFAHFAKSDASATQKKVKGKAPEIPFVANGVSYPSGYYLVDGIYPELTSLVKTIPEPTDDDQKRILYKQKQE
nr:ISWI chromatin-remodeling complex ATPase CHR11 isoform X1 [Tanacetum cinerariifolium]